MVQFGGVRWGRVWSGWVRQVRLGKFRWGRAGYGRVSCGMVRQVG
jgi:predicted short-subunit dehydrogenase-like oxidoreductase (DUF2520 family)